MTGKIIIWLLFFAGLALKSIASYKFYDAEKKGTKVIAGYKDLTIQGKVMFVTGFLIAIMAITYGSKYDIL